MASLDDFQFQRNTRPDRITFDEPRSKLPWIVALLAVLVVAGAFAWFRWHRSSQAPANVTAAATPSTATARASQPLGGQPEDIEVPPLGESDPVVRTLVQALSSHPRVAAWLATDGLIRNFTVVVDNIAAGTTPARHLPVLKPSGRFGTIDRGGSLHIDPASYSRYDDLAAAVQSIDPQAAARVYGTLKPRIEEAHRELGETVPFDGTLEEAIVQLVRTPVPQDDRVVARGAEAFQYADARTEALTGPQKLLLRMGPRNAAIVKEKLRQIGLALGIPAERL